MKSVFYHLACCVVLVSTLWGGWIHGGISNRWGSDEALRQAANQLRKPLADRFGSWRLLAEQSFSSDVVQMLQCPAHICRTYTNDQTGDTINVAVIVGPPGPIAVHTPEICYSSRDYQITRSRVATTIRDRSGQMHVMWDTGLQANDIAGLPLRAMYGWGTGGPWMASENPRFSHAGTPYLYKIQVSASVGDAGNEYDPCQDFLEAFLAELQNRLIQQDSSTVHAAELSTS